MDGRGEGEIGGEEREKREERGGDGRRPEGRGGDQRGS